MGGKVLGHRMMVTVPEEVYPLVKELAEMQGIPEATFVRMILKEMEPQFRELVVNLRKIHQGDKLGGLMGFSAAVMRMQQQMAGMAAESFDEVAKATAESKKKVQNRSPKRTEKKAIS